MHRHDRARWARVAVVAVCVALGLAGAAVSATTTSSVAPGAVLDQSNPSRDSACRFTGWVPDDPADWAAETFTAGVTGKLTEVAVWLRVNDPRISVAIAPVGPDGRPVVATPLATAAPVVAPTTSYVAVEAAFATPARVEAGRQYAVVVSAASGASAGPWTWKADLGSSTVDPSGTRCAAGAYAGGRFWVSNTPIGPDADFFFQTYVVPARQVTVQKVGTGTGVVQDATRVIDCGSTCSGEFGQADTLTLTATPDAGSTFSGWSGACTGRALTCSVRVGGDLSVTAEFSRILAALTVRTLGRGTVVSSPAGIRCGRACSHRFAPGPVTLTAKPARGWRFARWRGACRGTRAVCRLTLLRAQTVAASFTRTRRGRK